MAAAVLVTVTPAAGTASRDVASAAADTASPAVAGASPAAVSTVAADITKAAGTTEAADITAVGSTEAIATTAVAGVITRAQASTLVLVRPITTAFPHATRLATMTLTATGCLTPVATPTRITATEP